MTQTLLEQLSHKTGMALKDQDLMLVTAESCTGGGLSFYITAIAGSADWFERGFVTYSNEAKMEMLNVESGTLAEFGAVSEQTARQMAEGALTHSRADISVAITGIAGPDGGTENKPVGTVWLAFARRNHKTRTLLIHCNGNRETVRNKTIEAAFNTLLEMLE